jgi:LuxR family transcriptional regulator, maltose regulon positive regulatory protein
MTPQRQIASIEQDGRQLALRHPVALLRSKMRPAGISTSCLPRTALVQRLCETGSRVVLIDSPAGYGKTTLLGQVFHALNARNLPTAWLTFDADDSSPGELLEYVLGVFLDANLLGRDAPEVAARMRQAASPRAAIAALLAAAATRNTVFLFDDLHLVSAPECIAVVRLLLEHACASHRFLIGSRGRPPLDVSKLQVQGQLEVVSAAQMAFTRAEIAQWTGRCENDPLVVELQEKTRGWAVALRLFAAAAPDHQGELEALVASLCAGPAIADYLAEQVLSHLPPHLQQFLAVTSLPARLTAGLADRLCARCDGQQVLEQLERQSIFLARSDGEAGWYQYHGFFREFLRNRLADQSGLDSGVLHRRAAEWLFAHRQLDEALQHAIEASAWDLAIEILESGGGWRLALERGSRVLRGVAAIPEAAMERSLLARLTLVYLLMHLGQVARAREHFERLRVDSDNYTRWRGEAIERTARAEIQALDALLTVCEEKPLAVEVVERIRADAHSVGSGGRFVQLVTESSLSIYAHYDAGLYRECIRLAEEGLIPLERAGAAFSVGYLQLYLGMSHFALGQLRRAQSWFLSAHDLARLRFPHESLRLEALAWLAETQYEQDDIEAARTNIAAVFEELKGEPAVDSAVFQIAYPTAAALRFRERDIEGTLSLLMEARAVATYVRSERLLGLIEICRVEALTRAGYCADATELVGQRGFQQSLAAAEDRGSGALVAMGGSLALARLDLATGDALAAERRLSAVRELSRAHQNEIIRVRCLTLLAAAHFASGNRLESMDCLRELCSRVIPTGLKRILIDEKPLIEPALDHLLHECERPGTAAHVNAQIIADAWLAQPHDPARKSAASEACAAADASAGILSPRQREVLELLAAGLSGKEIATRLALSESTIKSYRKALYAKLQAGRRSQALSNARRMSLLE